MMIVGPNTYRQIVSQLISCEKTSNQSKIELTAVENGRPKSGTTIFEIMCAGIVTQIYFGDLRAAPQSLPLMEAREKNAHGTH